MAVVCVRVCACVRVRVDVDVDVDGGGYRAATPAPTGNGAVAACAGSDEISPSFRCLVLWCWQAAGYSIVNKGGRGVLVKDGGLAALNTSFEGLVVEKKTGAAAGHAAVCIPLCGLVWLARVQLVVLARPVLSC